jgi:AcrR family transcriptional regulator
VNGGVNSRRAGAALSSPRSPRRGGPRRGALLEEEIVRAAALCFGEVGFRATTLDAVAQRAGVSKVTLYRYVASKEELLWRVFERTIANFQSGLRALMRQGASPVDTLRRIVRYQIQLVTGHLPFLTVFFSEEAGLPPELARRVAQAKRAYDRAIERVVRAGIRRGELRRLDPTLVVFALLGACNWLYKWYRPHGRLSPDQIADVVISLFEEGYRRRDEETGATARALRGIERRLAALERRWAEGSPGG